MIDNHIFSYLDLGLVCVKLQYRKVRDKTEIQVEITLGNLRKHKFNGYLFIIHNGNLGCTEKKTQICFRENHSSQTCPYKRMKGMQATDPDSNCSSKIKVVDMRPPVHGRSHVNF